MQINISTTLITNSDIKDELLEKSLEKEKVLVNLLEELKENKKAPHPEILPSNRPSISFVDPCANFTAQKQSTIRNC